MRLDRIKRIRGHRIFNDFTWPGNLEAFDRFNLIYGWNGSGKTTISNILRALQLRAAVQEGEVSYEIDGNAISSSGLLEATLPELRVFNRDTVTRSVFESPATSQLPPVFVFGEDSVELQRQVADLTEKLPSLLDAANRADIAAGEAERAVSTFASNKAREIKNLLLAPGSAYNNYNAGDFREKVTALGVATPAQLGEVERKKLLDLKGAALKESIALPAIPFPDVLALHREAQELLQKTVVSTVAADLIGEPVVAAWVQQGLALHTHDGESAKCRFCSQSLPPERLRALEAHFNDRFNAFAHEIEALDRRIVQAASALDGAALPDRKLLYGDFESSYDRERSSLLLSLSGVRQGLGGLAKAVRTKKDRIFESLALNDLLLGGGGTSEEMSFINGLLSAVVVGGASLAEFSGKTSLARLQDIIKQHNDRTSAFEDEVRAARQRLHDHEIAVAAPEWRELSATNKAAADLKRETAHAVSDARRKIGELEADILQHRPAAQELNRDLLAYLGHDEIQVLPEKTGYQLMRRGVPAANLSEGERTAIAFLHFLRSLNDRSFDMATGIVVVDDPISSLDSNSTYTAFGFLKERLKDANQLFVLTHNFTFFRQVRNWFQFINRNRPNRRAGQPARFYMLRVGIDAGVRCARIELLDKFLIDYQSEYHYLFKRVLEASEQPLGQPLANYYDLPNLGRRLLETFLVFKVPDKGSLHARLQEVTFPEPRKTRLLRFVDTHSHAEQIGEGHEEAAALAEAPVVLRDLLDLIAEVDAEHFARMQAAIAP